MLDSDFIYDSMIARYNPFHLELDDNVTAKLETKTITKVDPEKHGYVGVETEGSYSFVPLFSAQQVRPKVGDNLTLYLRSFNYIQGMAINDKVVFYRPDDLQKQHEDREQQNAAAWIERAKQSFVPNFDTIGKFKIKAGKEEAWQKHVKLNSTDQYSFGTVQYASNWAKFIEKDMYKFGIQADDSRFGVIVKACEAAANQCTDGGITGFMYGCVVSILNEYWIHGDALREWHNKNVAPEQADEANEKGSVLNPAVLSIGVKEAT